MSWISPLTVPITTVPSACIWLPLLMIACSISSVQALPASPAAIRTGIDVLLEAAGIRAIDVQDWNIAGAFGTYINLESAIRIGLFPAAPLDRFRQVGNAAGIGARRALLSRQIFGKAEQFAREVK